MIGRRDITVGSLKPELDTSPARKPLKQQLDEIANSRADGLSITLATKALTEVIEEILKRVEALEDKGWTMEDMNGPTLP